MNYMTRAMTAGCNRVPREYFPGDKTARPIDTMRTQAEQLGLRIVELSATRWMVTSGGHVIYRAGSMRDLQMFLAMRASA